MPIWKTSNNECNTGCTIEVKFIESIFLRFVFTVSITLTLVSLTRHGLSRGFQMIKTALMENITYQALAQHGLPICILSQDVTLSHHQEALQLSSSSMCLLSFKLKMHCSESSSLSSLMTCNHVQLESLR